jgi:hypothetical protein
MALFSFLFRILDQILVFDEDDVFPVAALSHAVDGVVQAVVLATEPPDAISTVRITAWMERTKSY